MGFFPEFSRNATTTLKYRETSNNTRSRALNDGKLIIKRNANTNGTETVNMYVAIP